jgi:hypothetical protein
LYPPAKLHDIPFELFVRGHFHHQPLEADGLIRIDRPLE